MTPPQDPRVRRALGPAALEDAALASDGAVWEVAECIGPGPLPAVGAGGGSGGNLHPGATQGLVGGGGGPLQGPGFTRPLTVPLTIFVTLTSALAIF